MAVQDDYREMISNCMLIMRDQRKKLEEDVLRHYSGLYFGLHEITSERVRQLYFDQYQMEWLGNHWLEFEKSIQKLSKREQRKYTSFFAEFYSELIQSLVSEIESGSAGLPELIKAQQESLHDLIEMSDEWDERGNQLQVSLKKQKALFKRMIEEAKSNQGGR